MWLAAPAASAATAECAVTNTTTGASYIALYQAVDAAASGDALSVTGTCFGGIVIRRNLTITGQPGATVEGGNLTTVLTIFPGVTVAINTITITNGRGYPVGPGGIFNEVGTLTLDNVTVTGNRGDPESGAVLNEGGTITLGGSTSITGNSGGPGIFNELGTVTVAGSSSISGNNDGGFQGGGIVNQGGTLTLSGTASVTGNFAALGGGIFSLGPVTLTGHAAVSGNIASVNGGGIYTVGGPVTLSGSAIVTGNSAPLGGGVFYLGNPPTGDVANIFGNTPDNIATF